MNTEKHLPQADEMRQIIKNIFELSSKVSFKIKITNLEEAADLAVRLYGFNSWKEYKLYLNKETIKLQIKNPTIKIKKPIFNDIVLSKLVAYDVEKHTNRTIVNIPLKSNKTNILNEWLIGNHYNKLIKYKAPKSILSKDGFITGGAISEINNVFISHISWLAQNKQTSIIFGCEENSRVFNVIKKDLNDASITIVGKNHVALNPLMDLILSESAEEFFYIDQKLDNNFSFIWLQLVRKLISENKKHLNIKDMISFTELPVLLEFYKLLKNTDSIMSNLLYNYLFNYCDIQIQDLTEHYILSSSSMEKHFIHSHNLIYRLNEIKHLYQEGIFDENSNYSISKSILNKDSVFILKEKNQCYMDIMMALYHKAYIEHEKELKYINPYAYKYWLVFWDAEQWINQNNAIILSQLNETHIKIHYVSSSFSHLAPLLVKSKQILFLTQNLEGYQNSWKDKMLCETSISEVNFWYDNCKVLKTLENGKALLWQLIDLNANSESVEEYQMQMIDLYKEIFF